MIRPNNILCSTSIMRILDHSLQDCCAVYQWEIPQCNSDISAVNPGNVLYSNYRLEFIYHVLQQ